MLMLISAFVAGAVAGVVLVGVAIQLIGGWE